jgi:hypothetical protein
VRAGCQPAVIVSGCVLLGYQSSAQPEPQHHVQVTWTWKFV